MEMDVHHFSNIKNLKRKEKKNAHGHNMLKVFLLSHFSIAKSGRIILSLMMATSATSQN
jgi:hypothetical protein